MPMIYHLCMPEGGVVYSVTRQLIEGDASMKRHLLTLVLSGLLGRWFWLATLRPAIMKKCHHAAPPPGAGC